MTQAVLQGCDAYNLVAAWGLLGMDEWEPDHDSYRSYQIWLRRREQQLHPLEGRNAHKREHHDLAVTTRAM